MHVAHNPHGPYLLLAPCGQACLQICSDAALGQFWCVGRRCRISCPDLELGPEQVVYLIFACHVRFGCPVSFLVGVRWKWLECST
jgi:hypothetical protein